MTRDAPDARGGWFQRIILPGLAFKAAVIGGGYATGREIAEFFLPYGFWGGLSAILLATIMWSVICALTFSFAHQARATDYRAFFGALLGRGWPLFEICNALFCIVILAVYGAAAGEIGSAVLHLPKFAGIIALMVGIAGVAAFGNRSVERLFAYVSVLLYGVYILFLIFSLTSFGDRMMDAAAATFALPAGWAAGGITYAGYNIIGAVIILPVTRHLRSRADGVKAGIIAGPLAMLPAVLFFLSMSAFAADIARSALPSDFLLERLGRPGFRIIFQLMIFAALLESGTGSVNAINQRIAAAWSRRTGRALGIAARAAIAGLLLVCCMLLADRVGLVALIANGYRALSYALIAIYVIPILFIGGLRLLKPQTLPEPA